ncbi:dephospho-CoA kinase [Mucilaginibacter jinjuensis]|uniref:Dephospho-CoA kinase n=1 Tax=Mucilaginibacter jinjuensis TaxID=1176721 RepID=A0ABY7TC81_9SPHI|nr:dephospho-CoA kinase [Mucilaginibacter jinjuensis]WCT14120.1 dephospho-CoA kinase [Mucilaginibacter jinjuensis]
MLKIGITGNIGSGKTTVSKVFELLGVPVFYADAAAREVMTNDEELISGVKQAFGIEAYFEDGSLNRKYIAGKVFNDPAELAKLNTLVHPATFRAFDNWAKSFPDAPYLMKEAAILFESGSYKLCDYSIIVTAPKEVRMQRVIARDNISIAEVESRDARQMPEEEKVKLANFRIKNDDTQLVIPQVLALHQQFLALAQTK